MMAQLQATKRAPQPQPTVTVKESQEESGRNTLRLMLWANMDIGIINIVFDLFVIYTCKKKIDDIYAYNQEGNGTDAENKSYTVLGYEVPLILCAVIFMALMGIIFSVVEIWIASGVLFPTREKSTIVQYKTAETDGGNAMARQHPSQNQQQPQPQN